MSQPEDEPLSAGPPADRLNAFLARNQLGGEGQVAINLAAAEILSELASAKVDALLLKGAGLAQLLYEPGEVRSYVDVDILVRPDHLPATAEILVRLGYRNITERLGIDDIADVVHEELWVGQAGVQPSAVQIEAHHWLPGAQAAPAVAWEVLWRRRISIELAGQTVPVLDRPGQALQLAMHVAQHGSGFLKGIRELALAVERWPIDVWEEAKETALELGGAEAFAAGLRLLPSGALVADQLGLPVDARLTWEVTHREERPRGLFHLEVFRQADLAHRLHILRRALLPNTRWIAMEYPWVRKSRAAWVAAYGLHFLRAPAWAARSWLFARRKARDGG